ncbi:Antithrombin-III [Thelohanellus kitauei]|uniref:Antithrombin-III n=1 Tax=Thelohanellus kitauei TaxID=669202 RepID=A0A0C2MHW3_THEKT|nr:Antithrombin-III [Thelohanellus kitauei]
MAFSGIGFYVVMEMIKFGLSGRSYNQLSTALLQDVEDPDEIRFFDPSPNAKILTKIRYISQFILMTKSVFFYSCDLNKDYQSVSKMVFGQSMYKVNKMNIKKSTYELNKWISSWTFGSLHKIFKEWMLRNDNLIAINAFNFHADWLMNFDPVLTKNETFYDEDNKKLEIEMMNQKSENALLDSPQYNFTILFKQLHEVNIYSAIVLPREGHSLKDLLTNFKVF